ncbi:MAG: hypothetical protein SGARI_000967 [Bacillariaceae sp.]
MPPITVFGSDFDAANVATTSALLQQKLEEYNDDGNNSPPFSVGSICQAKPTNLSHVPSNTFDAVFASHLRLLRDPLELDKDGDDDSIPTLEMEERHRQICEIVSNKKADKDVNEVWMANELYAIVRQRQDEYVGQWVAEMVRTAKPGAPIVLEQVSSTSFCDAIVDYTNKESGGVDHDFWKRNAERNTYGWNVDPTSVVIQDDQIDATRYHVVMLKKG